MFMYPLIYKLDRVFGNMSTLGVVSPLVISSKCLNCFYEIL